MEGISSRLLHRRRIKEFQREVIPKMVVLEDYVEEGAERIEEGGEIPAAEVNPIEPVSVLESPDVLEKWIPIGDLEAPEVSTGARETTYQVNMIAISPTRGEAAGVLDSEASPSNPTPRGVMVDIPARVNLCTDLPVAAQILGSFLGPVGRIKLEVSDLENSLSQLVASILQSHLLLLATTTLKKAKDQTVERLRAEAGKIRSTMARLRADNEMLLAIRASLAQRLEEIQREQEEREVELSSLTEVNKNLKAGEQTNLSLVNEALREKLAQLKADRARLEAQSNELRARRKADKYVADLDRNWAIAEAEAAGDAVEQVLEQALFEYEEEDSECKGSVGLSGEEDGDASDAPPLA
ncbi:hypothetical protein RND71_014419 [Anisodus tanguticus]|uniref:Uncharacterized protein n=1 Tax=Anisodus tanguticus TaxID=243964 RepID=A0AAE1S927_9SOLA|nr:hypothetical protein RND71_014419 [Anisodus tanguticus]